MRIPCHSPPAPYLFFPEQEPGKYLQPLCAAGASGITFQIESVGLQEAVQLAQAIRVAGIRAGVALAPGTSTDAVWPLVQAGEVDMVGCLCGAGRGVRGQGKGRGGARGEGHGACAPCCMPGPDGGATLVATGEG